MIWWEKVVLWIYLLNSSVNKILKLMEEPMNKTLLLLTVFSLGYMMNDILRENNINLIDKVKADVAGMSWYDLKYDYDFKKAVKRVVEDNCESDSDGAISC